LTARDWIEFALLALADQGFEALKPDARAQAWPPARQLLLALQSLRTFHAQAIEHWRGVATDAIITDLDRYGSAESAIEGAVAPCLRA